MTNGFGIKNSAKGVEIDILTDIGQGFFSDGYTMNDARSALKEAGDESITVNISSLGGDVNDALVIHDLFQSYPGIITANIMGATASAGTIIALGADYVRMSENSLFLVHNAWTGAIGDADQLRAVADNLDKFDERIINIYKRKTGRREATIRKLMKEEKWIDASEAFDWGFIDETYRPMKAAASINIEKIEASKKLPPLPNEIINQKKEDMNLIEKLNEIKTLIIDKFKGLEQPEDNILDQPEVAEAMDQIEGEIKAQAESYAAELQTKDEEIAELIKQVEAVEDYKNRLDQANEQIETLTAELDKLQAKPVDTPVDADPDPQAKVEQPKPSKFGEVEKELKDFLKKYQTKKE